MDDHYKVAEHYSEPYRQYLLVVSAFTLTNLVIASVVDSKDGIGEANYCRVNQYASRAEFKACAASGFMYNTSACSNVYPPIDKT